MNKNTETIEDKCRDVLNYLYPNNETEMSCLQNKNSIDALKSIANWQKEQNEAKIKVLELCFEQAKETNKVLDEQWEVKYKALLDSHNELLEFLEENYEYLNPKDQIVAKKLINKAKNI